MDKKTSITSRLSRTSMGRRPRIFDRRRARRSLNLGALLLVCLMATGYAWSGARGALDLLLRPGFAPFFWYYGGILELGFFGLLGFVFDVALYAIVFYGLLTLGEHLAQPAATLQLRTETPVTLAAPLRRARAGGFGIFRWRHVRSALALEILFLIFLMAASAKWTWPVHLLFRPQPWSRPVLWIATGVSTKELLVSILGWNILLLGLIFYVLVALGDYLRPTGNASMNGDVKRGKPGTS